MKWMFCSTVGCYGVLEEEARRKGFSREQQGRNRKNDGCRWLGSRVRVHVGVSQGTDLMT